MKITGIIVEYNPLHNGHLYHINETKRRSNCDILIAVMSGNFVQRGEPAIVNKHLRTELALKSGIDIVIELPYLYAVSSADIFAYGAVKILNELNVSDIYFGSETDNIITLTEISKLIDTDEFNEEIQSHLRLGIGYPKACEITINKLTKVNYLFNSNDILGIQYIRNVNKINHKIMCHTIKRVHNNYNDVNFTHDSIASATSIRNALLNQQNIINYVPEYTFNTLKNNKLVSWDDFFPYLKYQININQNNLHLIYDVNEGIENAIINNISLYDNIDSFVTSLVSKRYTKAKIKRMLTHILNNVLKADISIEKGPQYIRVLGINKNKSNIIQKIKQFNKLPIITNIDKSNYHLIKFDEQINNVYHLADNKKSIKIPIIID